MRRSEHLPLLPRTKGALTSEKLVEHFKSHLAFEETWADKLADVMTLGFGTMAFFTVNLVVFLFWVMWNSVSATPFDRFPFNFLTMSVSLEAIFLSIIVLISQNRQSKIADLRQKLDFEINVRSEEEITKMLVMIEEMQLHMGIEHSHDHELEWMKRKTDLEELQKEAEEEEQI